MRVLFLGGDSRQEFASNFLNYNGIYSEVYINFSINDEIIEKIKTADVIVLPLPLTRDGTNLNMLSKNTVLINELSRLFDKYHVIMGGNINGLLGTPDRAAEYKLIDYNQIESFQIYNALLSAEGAIYYAKERMSSAIYGSRIAILGFGRIGKILAYLLRSLGAKITVFARKDKDCTWSTIIGFDAYKIKNMGISCIREQLDNPFDVIFNTIPERVMGEEFAKAIPFGTVIMDLASKPYGIDDELVEKYQLKYYRESGIPGRYSPKRAGEILGQTVMNILEEENYL